MRKSDIERMVGQQVTFRKTGKYDRQPAASAEILGYGYRRKRGMRVEKMSELTLDHFEEVGFGDVLVIVNGVLMLVAPKDLDIRPVAEVVAERNAEAEVEKQSRLRHQRRIEIARQRAKAVCRHIGVDEARGWSSWSADPEVSLKRREIDELIAKHGLEAPEYEEEST